MAHGALYLMMLYMRCRAICSRVRRLFVAVVRPVLLAAIAAADKMTADFGETLHHWAPGSSAASSSCMAAVVWHVFVKKDEVLSRMARS